jgi:hypothetical protein
VVPRICGVAGQRETEVAAIEICRACECPRPVRRVREDVSPTAGGSGPAFNRAARSNRVPSEISHGTEAGAKQHHRRGEPPCLSCRNAATLANALRKDRRRSA